MPSHFWKEIPSLRIVILWQHKQELWSLAKTQDGLKEVFYEATENAIEAMKRKSCFEIFSRRKKIMEPKNLKLWGNVFFKIYLNYENNLNKN